MTPKAFWSSLELPLLSQAQELGPVGQNNFKEELPGLGQPHIEDSIPCVPVSHSSPPQVLTQQALVWLCVAKHKVHSYSHLGFRGWSLQRSLAQSHGSGLMQEWEHHRES